MLPCIYLYALVILNYENLNATLDHSTSCEQFREHHAESQIDRKTGLLKQEVRGVFYYMSCLVINIKQQNSMRCSQLYLEIP